MLHTQIADACGVLNVATADLVSLISKALLTEAWAEPVVAPIDVCPWHLATDAPSPELG